MVAPLLTAFDEQDDRVDERGVVGEDQQWAFDRPGLVQPVNADAVAQGEDAPGEGPHQETQ